MKDPRIQFIFSYQRVLLVRYEEIREIYRYKTEEYSTEATNKFNIHPAPLVNGLDPGRGRLYDRQSTTAHQL